MSRFAPSPWIACLAGIILPAVAPAAEPIAAPSSCSTSACPASPPKVIVHVPEPEIVFENTKGHSHCRDGFHCFHRLGKGNAGNVTTSSSLTPMSFTSGFAGQGFALNGMNVQGYGFGAQAYGSDGSDLTELRYAQQLELLSTRIAAMQAVREAEMQAYKASSQRVRAYLSGISAQGIGDKKVETQGQGAESACEQLKKEIQKLQTDVGKLRSEIGDIKKLIEKAPPK